MRIDEYAQNLERVLTRMAPHVGQLIWATTTCVPDGEVAASIRPHLPPTRDG